MPGPSVWAMVVCSLATGSRSVNDSVVGRNKHKFTNSARSLVTVIYVGVLMATPGGRSFLSR